MIAIPLIIFVSLAVVGVVLLIVSTFFADDIDTAPQVEGGDTGFFSLRSIAVFLTAFGSVGAIASVYGQRAMASSIWGLLAGVAMSVIYILAMNMVRSQQASSLIETEELIGLTARVTVAIPAEGLGEVSCHVKSQVTRRMARAKNRQSISEGAVVRIVELQGDVALVEPIG
jgi:membrane protein implicated in regulation of membrane protease activity